jgi:hypothetical protein
VTVPPKKSGDASEIFCGSPVRAAAGGGTPCLFCPAKSRAEKEKSFMTEHNQIRQTENESAGPQVSTVRARGSAEREEKTNNKPMVSWAALLDEAVSKPGFIHQAYSRFHNYSLGNQFLALFQCFERGITPGPLASFGKWKQLGRRVKKGEKALVLCVPLSCQKTRTVKKDDGTEQEEEFTYTHFAYKSNWFVLSQTEGKEYQPPAIPEWNEQKALAALKIERIPFEDLNGNCQGYARRGGFSPCGAPTAPPRKISIILISFLQDCQEVLFSFQKSPQNARFASFSLYDFSTGFA